MNENLAATLDQILGFYTQEKYRDQLIRAKEIYTEMTGKLNEEDDEYENRMNLFNMWYIFDFLYDGKKTISEDYQEMEDLPVELTKALLSVSYGLFEFLKINMKKQVVLFDFLNGEKKILADSEKSIGLVDGDLFTARLIQFKEQPYLLPGLCILPGEIRNELKKQSKKIRKLKNESQEMDFLLSLEKLKTKSRTYAHLDASKIFVFAPIKKVKGL